MQFENDKRNLYPIQTNQLKHFIYLRGKNFVIQQQYLSFWLPYLVV